MLKLQLLIVDDEKLDREGLFRQLDWAQHHISEVFLAKNGPAALEIMEQHSIDILFTDIKMPRMTGVELAQRARQRNPALRIVFISGYDDFQYMKIAIQINAFEYMLKPVNIGELRSCVDGIVGDIVNERKKRTEESALLWVADEGMPLLRQKFMLDLIFGVADDFERRTAELEMTIEPGWMAVLLIEVDNLPGFTNAELAQRMGELQRAIRALTHPFSLLEVVQVEKGHLAVIVGASIELDAMEGEVSALAEAILRSVTDSFGVTIGVGNTVAGLHELNASYDRSVKAVLGKLYKGNGAVLYYDGDDEEDALGSVQKIDYDIAGCLLKLDLAKANYLLDFMFDSFEQQKNNDRQNVQYHCINIISRIEIILSDLNVQMEDILGNNVSLIGKLLKFETILDIRQWMKNIIRAAIEYLAAKRTSKSSRIVAEIVAYVETKYAQDISLNAIAQILFYSPNHLGNIFRQEFGKGFGEYLTEYRIKRAAELLQDHKMKILEASLAVGYKDMPTFIKNFKALYGVTPSEYRERRAL